MQAAGRASLLLALLATVPLAARAAEAGTDPMGKVLQLMSDLSAKITKDGEAEAIEYKKYFERCDSMAQDTKFAIKTASSQKDKLEAKIGELASVVQTSSSKIEDLIADISTATADLKSATEVRKKEAADFKASEAELVDAVDTLDRALAILEREMQKNPASLAQIDTTSTEALLRSLGVVIEAAGFSGGDRERLVALVQSQHSEAAENGDEELGAPAAAAYKSHSSSIVDLLEDMKEKADSQLSELRKAETTAKNNFALLKQSLEDQVAADNKGKDDAKAAKAAAEEGKAAAEGELATSNKALKTSQQAIEEGKAGCMQTAADHEATVKSREEELKVLAEAMKILKETSGGAVSQSYSLLQLGAAAGLRMQSRADLARSEVLTLVKHLAREHHSAALAQLASRIAAVVRYGAGSGTDPFAKVKGLIQNLIGQLEKEMQAEATEKAYCDEEMSKTEAKKGELEDDTSKLSTKIDQAAAKSAELKEQIKELQSELSALAKSQAEMDAVRQESHKDYVQSKADLQTGLAGVQRALGVLNEYYATKEDGSASLLQGEAELEVSMRQPEMPAAHSKATGAGTGIIGLLEVIESDFASNLAKEETEEGDAQLQYEKITQENKVEKAEKEQDVKYKTQEAKALGKSLSELSGDRNGLKTELDAVLEYYSKLKERCIAKPESYEVRKKRREAEISGLKEALSVLETETALVQRQHRGGNMRGSLLPR